jgi:hypothetical protein
MRLVERLRADIIDILTVGSAPQSGAIPTLLATGFQPWESKAHLLASAMFDPPKRFEFEDTEFL